MFQTLRLINPTLCEGSLVSEYLGQLMNDLQVLQGRLEVIPEEDDFHTHGRDLHSWQEHMAEHVSQQEAVCFWITFLVLTFYFTEYVYIIQLLCSLAGFNASHMTCISVRRILIQSL